MILASGKLRTGALCATVALGAFGAGVVPASAHYYTTRCDRDGDDCYRVRCDDDGDDCSRVYGYSHSYYRPRYYSYSYGYNYGYPHRYGYYGYYSNEHRAYDDDDD